MELRVALPALLRRFPTLRLTAPDEELGLRPGHHNLHGLDRLPVAW
ncbi:hypothetical protein [Actinosynnema pretiosum]|nr:hypothetical protein [Actinosynnema pretiosum]